MKQIGIIIFSILLSSAVFSQDVTTVEATSTDISDNLDLEAVASIFGESKDLEDFENRLNDPEAQISNLDLNNDGYVDYLRVVENSESNAHLVTIQSVLGDDLFQDVATIEVEKDNQGTTRVQVVGDVYMYGYDYIIEPVYVHRPIIFTWFWSPRHVLWYSPYYWNYYPRYYSYWRPYSTEVYANHIHRHVRRDHAYHYVSVRRSSTCVEMNRKTRRHALGKDKPRESFNVRNSGVSNRAELVRKREAKLPPKAIDNNRLQPVKQDPVSSKKDSKVRQDKPVSNQNVKQDNSDRQKVREDWKPKNEAKNAKDRTKVTRKKETERTSPNVRKQPTNRNSTPDVRKQSTNRNNKPDVRKQNKPNTTRERSVKKERTVSPKSQVKKQAAPKTRTNTKKAEKKTEPKKSSKTRK